MHECIVCIAHRSAEIILDSVGVTYYDMKRWEIRKRKVNFVNIERNRVKEIFAEYVSHYDAQDEKVKLKIDHTYRVAELCDAIARSVNLTTEEIDLAWLCGMLHDIGRFEQIKNYGTFIDADSVDHALYGAKILFDEEKIYAFLTEPTKNTLDLWDQVMDLTKQEREAGGVLDMDTKGLVRYRRTIRKGGRYSVGIQHNTAQAKCLEIVESSQQSLLLGPLCIAHLTHT